MKLFITLMQAKNSNNELIIELKYEMSILNDVTHKILFIYQCYEIISLMMNYYKKTLS